jgi:hypothetical protein
MPDHVVGEEPQPAKRAAIVRRVVAAGLLLALAAAVAVAFGGGGSEVVLVGRAGASMVGGMAEKADIGIATVYFASCACLCCCFKLVVSFRSLQFSIWSV